MDKVINPYWPQGHKVKVKVTKVISVFCRFYAFFWNSSHSFDRRVLKTHRNVLWDHTQRSHAAEFWIFALKVKYQGFKVKHWNTHLTALMTPNLHQIEVIGRYGQAHDPLLTTRLKSRSLRSSPFLPILRVFCNLTLWNFYRCFAIYYPAPRHCCFCRFCMFRRYFRIQHLFGALLSCPSAADPISLDMLVNFCPTTIFKHY